MTDGENYRKNNKEPVAKNNSAKDKNQDSGYRKEHCFPKIWLFEKKNINIIFGVKMMVYQKMELSHQKEILWKLLYQMYMESL